MKTPQRQTHSSSRFSASALMSSPRPASTLLLSLTCNTTCLETLCYWEVKVNCHKLQFRKTRQIKVSKESQLLRVSSFTIRPRKERKHSKLSMNNTKMKVTRSSTGNGEKPLSLSNKVSAKCAPRSKPLWTNYSIQGNSRARSAWRDEWNRSYREQEKEESCAGKFLLFLPVEDNQFDYTILLHN